MGEKTPTEEREKLKFGEAKRSLLKNFEGQKLK